MSVMGIFNNSMTDAWDYLLEIISTYEKEYECSCRCRTSEEQRKTLIWHFCRRQGLNSPCEPVECKCRTRCGQVNFPD